MLGYATQYSAGIDIESAEDCDIAPGEIRVVKTPISGKQIWEEKCDSKGNVYCGMLCSRSGLATKGIIVANAPGIIDTDYEGDIAVILYNIGKDTYRVNIGDRIAQLVVVPTVKVLDKVQRSDRVRGRDGLGSTGV